MNPGKLRDRIILLKTKETNSSVKPLGKAKFEEYKPTRTKVEYVSSKEIFSANANNTLNVVKFIIRYRKDIQPDMGVKYDNNVYEIKGIRPLDTKRMYLMIIGELVQHG